MRTKTLLLTAALMAAGVATSMAQAPVFSVNAVGYVNTTMLPAYNLISNPLKATDNHIPALFAGSVPGTQIFKYTSTGFKDATMDPDDLVFLGSAIDLNLEVLPGEGVFYRNPNPSANVTVTFVGEVVQGHTVNPLPAGLSIRSSIVPQAGTAEELGLVGSPGDQVFQFVPLTQKYYISTFDPDDLAWLDPLKPLAVGEAFFLRKVAAADWVRDFSVNTP